jgi:hypothetical protein
MALRVSPLVKMAGKSRADCTAAAGPTGASSQIILRFEFAATLPRLARPLQKVPLARGPLQSRSCTHSTLSAVGRTHS